MTGYNFFKSIFFIVLLTVAFSFSGCGSDSSGTSTDTTVTFVDDTMTISDDTASREVALKALFTEDMYNTITADSQVNPMCHETAATKEALDLPDGLNSEWYYTYDNLIAAMAQFEEFANYTDDTGEMTEDEIENLNKLEIAAFLANIAQETGSQGDEFGGPGCYIQEGNGGQARGSSAYSSRACETDYTCVAAGYCGRGPHQLSWDYNYHAFTEFMSEYMGDSNDYLADPDILTQDPVTGMTGSIWFWGHEEFTSSSPRDPDIPFKPAAHKVVTGEWTPTTADSVGVGASNDTKCGRTSANFGIIINLINGGVECGTTASNPGNATNRVNYLQAIAAEMGVTIPEGFLNNCSTQQNFAQCPSY